METQESSTESSYPTPLKRVAPDTGFDCVETEVEPVVDNVEYEEVERNHFFTPALPVAESLSNPEGPPIDGLEYLLMVRKDAASLPDFAVAKQKPVQVAFEPKGRSLFQNRNQMSSYALLLHQAGSQTAAAEHLRPDPEWQANLLTSFKIHKDNFFQLRQTSQPPPGHHPSLKRGNELNYLRTPSQPEGETLAGPQQDIVSPTPSRLANLEQSEALSLLRFFSSQFKSLKPITDIQSKWVFGLLLRLDDLLVADDISILRELSRNCLRLRGLETDDEDHVVHCNTISTLIALHFGQQDLSP